MTPKLLCPKCNSEVHLPQITAVEQLEALPVGTWLIGQWDGGPVFACWTPKGLHIREWSYTSLEGALRRFGPWTVVYQPQPAQEPADA